MMQHFLNEQRGAYFLQLVQQGAKLPQGFNVEDIIVPEVETPITAMMKQMHAMQVKLNQIEKEKVPKEFSMEALCPFPFDKNLYMPPFLKKMDIPKYDKYDGNSDPQDHVREFCT